MNFLDNLQAHKGCLIHLKTQLYWYKGRGWDNNPGRICLLLDAAPATAAGALAASPVSTMTSTSDITRSLLRSQAANHCDSFEARSAGTQR